MSKDANHLFTDKINEIRDRPDDDTQDNESSSETIKYSEEYECSTDQEIESIMEEMNKLADSLSISSVSENVNLEHSKNFVPKTLEELLEEAEELAKKNAYCLTEKILQSDSDSNMMESFDSHQSNSNIFQKLEEEIRRDLEKTKDYFVFEEDKCYQNEISQLPSTNVDNLFAENEKSEWLENTDNLDISRNNLQKELIDVDENFFDHALSIFQNDAAFNQHERPVKPLKLPLDFANDSMLKHLPKDFENDSLLKHISKDFENDSKLKHIPKDFENDSLLKHIPKNFENADQFLKLRGNQESDNTDCQIEEKASISGINNKSLEIRSEFCNVSKLGSTNNLYPVPLASQLMSFSITQIVQEKSKECDIEKNVQEDVQESVQENIEENVQENVQEKSKENVKQNVQEKSKENVKENVQEKSKENVKENIKENVQELNNKEQSKNLKTKNVETPQTTLNEQNISSLKENPIILEQKTENCPANNQILENFNFIAGSSKNHDAKEARKLFTKTKVSSRNAITKIKVPIKPRKELFSIKKHNIVLKERNEIFSKKCSPDFVKSSNKSRSEKEADKSLKDSFENERKKLVEDNERLQQEINHLHEEMNHLHEEMNHLHQEINHLHQEIIPEKVNTIQRQSTEIKELRKETRKLNFEHSELKEQNVDFMLKHDDIKQQNFLLNDELKMFKEQLIDKNNFIAEKLQTLTTSELRLRKEMEDLRVELNTKTESLKITKLNYEKLERTILPLEKELLELRVKEGNLQEKLEVTKSHVEREKQLSHKLKNQVILDSKKIMDLLRQLREMERSVMKKNPDSVSALLFSAKTEHDNLNQEKIKLLEIRNSALENEIKLKEEAAQQRLSIFRKDFDEMIKKYATQILDLEDKLLSKNEMEREKCVDTGTQTLTETTRSENTSNEMEPTKLIKSENLKLQKKNDVHLIATICKLKFELSNKNKALSKLTREYQELQKTNRRLQTEREKQLNEARCSSKNVTLGKKNNFSLKAKSSDINCNNSVAIQSDHCSSAPASKTYDPRQYHENSASSTIKNLTTENNILKEELFKMKKDFMSLKNKRLHDLNLLQEEHERELKVLIQKCSVQEEEINRLKLEGKKVIAMRVNSFQGSNAELLGYSQKHL